MLKIIITETPTEKRWFVHGRLAGPWADELRLNWKNACRESDTRRCIVELNDVTFIDRNGEAVLAEIMSQGAEFIGGRMYIKHLLGDLRSELKRTRMKQEKEDDTGNQL